ncbi:sodium- and chloride-dependent glycine transporter 2-like isoform X1 [Dysidea avara]|uniref:sodium- and chloride-dependent glycine transporter 2-like isoform X1 n=2 Tax=Dysidea avara TaxID=196820 RepID=UPI003320E80F
MYKVLPVRVDVFMFVFRVMLGATDCGKILSISQFSFHDPLPWENCCGYKVDHMNRENVGYRLMMGGNCSDVPTTKAIEECTEDFTKFVSRHFVYYKYYWYNHVIHVSNDIGDADEFKWQLLICMFCAWLITYLCLFRGIKSSGKAAYVTAVFPYIVVTILVFRGVTLDGSGDGVEFLFKSDWSKLYLPQVWLEAATQIFFSLGISTGGIIALSSYSSSSNTALRDTTFVCIVNSATSLFSSITIFLVLGFKAHETGVSIDDVANGPGLAFNVFTEAITLLPGSPFWAVLFFTILITLGVDGQFTLLESLLTVLFDSKHIAKIRKEIVIAVVCIVLFIVSIPFVLGNGFYLFQMFDQFSGTIPLLFITICEYIGIVWVYGTHKFLTGVVKPDRQGVFFFWWLWWTIVAPLLMIAVFIGSLATSFSEPLEYVRYQNSEEQNHIAYPGWTRFVGSLLVISTTLPIPLIFIIRLIWKKEEKKIAIDWFVNFPTRCRGAWDNFKQFWSNVELKKNPIYDRCCRHRSWTPNQPQFVDMQVNNDDDDGKDL